MEHAISATLVVGTDDPVDLRETMASTGLVCDEAVVAGDRRISPSGDEFPTPAKRSFWTMRVPRREVLDPEPVLVGVLDLIDRTGGRFQDTVEHHGLDVVISLHLHANPASEVPGGSFTPETLARVVALGASLDLDIYCWDTGTDLEQIV